jgi:hypothetical protein
MNGVEVELRVLRATVESGFANMNQRMDNHRADTNDRLDSVVDRLDLINGRVNNTAERVSFLEAGHRSIDKLLGEARTRWHDIAQRMQTWPHEASDDGKHLTRADLKHLIAAALTAASLGAGLTAWIFMQFGK